jgi:hypothetical protein
MQKLNILCTSKPCDGLLYYSYEYTQYIKSLGIDVDLIIVTHPKFSEKSYIKSIESKYKKFDSVIFDDIDDDGVTLVMGRSMITLPYKERYYYSNYQLFILNLLFRNKIIAIYSENHRKEYPFALEHFKPRHIIDLCDYDVYPNGVGKPFQKRIYFDVYKPLIQDKKFDYLINGTNNMYYESAMDIISKYPSHGILVYDTENKDTKYNHLIVPYDNLLGSFDTYVYTKKIVDPAPRIIQECKYFNKNIIFENSNIGAKIYYEREIEIPNVENILNEL